MPTKPEDLDGTCFGCVLAGGKHAQGRALWDKKCYRHDDTAKPELSKTLSLNQLYTNLEKDCDNSSSCSYIGLKGTYHRYEPKLFMADKKYQFVFGWNVGVKKFDHCI